MEDQEFKVITGYIYFEAKPVLISKLQLKKKKVGFVFVFFSPPIQLELPDSPLDNSSCLLT